MAYLTNGIIGADLSATHDTPQFKLGTMASGTDGTMWVYVHAADAVTQYDAVAIDEDYDVTPLTGTLALTGKAVGVAQVAFTDEYYGWVCIKGSNVNVRVAASCAASINLYTTIDAGILDDATGGTRIGSIVAVAANALTTASNVECILDFPKAPSF